MIVSEDEKQWHLDKRVPIAQMITVLLAILSGAWAISDAYNELKAVKKDVIELQEKIKSYDSRDLRTAERLASVEEQLRNTNRLLERIWAKMDSPNGTKN